MKTVRNCCGCTCLLIMLILVLLLSLVWLVITARPAHAQSGDILCANLPVVQSIAITPAIPLPTPSPNVRGAFFTKQLTATLRGGECVAVASTSDGHEGMWVDDAISIQVVRADGTTAHWEHDFRTVDRAQITSAPPQDVSALFVRGENHLTVILQDLSPNVFGSSALWLIIFAPPIPAASASPTRLIPTATVAGRTPTPTAQSPIGFTSTTPSPSLADSAPTAPISSQAVSMFVGAGISALGVLAVLVRRAHRPKAMGRTLMFPGTLHLFDEKTFESLTVELADWANGFVVLGDPLRIEANTRKVGALLHIVPCKEGVRVQVDGEQRDDPTLLHHSDNTNIGTLKLTLENHLGHSED